jgi:hypothetical protein
MQHRKQACSLKGQGNENLTNILRHSAQFTSRIFGKLEETSKKTFPEAFPIIPHEEKHFKVSLNRLKVTKQFDISSLKPNRCAIKPNGQKKFKFRSIVPLAFQPATQSLPHFRKKVNFPINFLN